LSGEEKEKYLQAAAECLDLARATQDRRKRTGLIALAEKWLDLADYSYADDSAFRTALEAFNDWQMKKKQ